MAKQRNSLGMIVLPVPYGTMTWDEYKQKYGIDLEKFFKVEKVGDTTDYRVLFRSGNTKLIILSATDELEGTGIGAPRIAIPNGFDMAVTSIDSASLALYVRDDAEVYGYIFAIKANKTVNGGSI